MEYDVLLFLIGVISCVGPLFYFLWRNKAIYNFRINMINKVSEYNKKYNYPQNDNFWRWYKQQPSYDSMMWKFWVIDFNSFLTESIEEYAQRMHDE